MRCLDIDGFESKMSSVLSVAFGKQNFWAVYNYWTGWWTGLVDWMVDWTGGLTLKTIFMASNKTYWLVGLYDALC